MEKTTKKKGKRKEKEKRKGERASQRFYRGFAMVLTWFYNGFVMALQWLPLKHRDPHAMFRFLGCGF